MMVVLCLARQGHGPFGHAGWVASLYSKQHRKANSELEELMAGFESLSTAFRHLLVTEDWRVLVRLLLPVIMHPLCGVWV